MQLACFVDVAIVVEACVWGDARVRFSLPLMHACIARLEDVFMRSLHALFAQGAVPHNTLAFRTYPVRLRICMLNTFVYTLSMYYCAYVRLKKSPSALCRNRHCVDADWWPPRRAETCGIALSTQCYIS